MNIIIIIVIMIIIIQLVLRTYIVTSFDTTHCVRLQLVLAQCLNRDDLVWDYLPIMDCLPEKAVDCFLGRP